MCSTDSVAGTQQSGGISPVSLSSSKQKVPNSCPSFSSCSLASGSTSSNLDKLSAKVFFVPWIHSSFRLNCSNSTAQFLTFAFSVCFCRNFFKGRWSHFNCHFCVCYVKTEFSYRHVDGIGFFHKGCPVLLAPSKLATYV